MPKQKTVIVHTLFTALEKARAYCAYQERSHRDVREKLYSLGLNKEEVEQALAVLVEEGFLNEERFAMAYASGKFRIKKWGRIKIRVGLRHHGVSEYCIRKALAEINEQEYINTLRVLIGKKKAAGSKSEHRIRILQALLRTGISHGFEPELVRSMIGLTENE